MKVMEMMKQKASKRIAGAAAGLMGFMVAAPASAAGLDKAKGMFETLQSELTTIVPIVAALALLLLSIGYAASFIRKETYFQWVVGVVIAGSATQITAMLFT